MEEDPIARKRSRGGHIDVGDESDGAIMSMMNIGNRTFVIKEKSIYELIMADDIDPGRTNIQVPNMIHKLVLSQGIDSQIVSQIFLTAAMFFTKEHISDKELLGNIWKLIVELNKEAINLQKHIEDYYEKEKLANEKYDRQRAGKQAPALPAIEDLETTLKTIFQKADHMYQVMVELAATVLAELKVHKQAHFITLYDAIKAGYGEQHGFTEFLEQNLDFLKTIREMRNGLDHRQPKVIVKDYQFNPDTTVSLPSLSLNSKVATLSEMPVSAYLNELESLFSFAEVFICHLANVSVRTMGAVVQEIPAAQRRFAHVRYSFYYASLDFYKQ